MPNTKRETSEADLTLQPKAKPTARQEQDESEGDVRSRAGQLSTSLIRSQFGGSHAEPVQLKRAPVQRQATEEEEEEEEELQLKRAPVQRQATEEEEEEEEELQLKRAPVQRQSEEDEEEEEEEEEVLQPKTKAGARGPVQRVSGRKGGRRPNAHAVADRGVEGASTPLPHLDRIQAAFGDHDLSGVKTSVGGAAADASDALGADAYATGNTIGFRADPDLHTAAHEAAHVVQQRAGVQLKGGLGKAGDQYERHADEVADRVVQGDSAEDLLDSYAGRGEGAQQPDRSPRSERDVGPGEASGHRGIVTLQPTPAAPAGAVQLQAASTAKAKKKAGKRGYVGQMVPIRSLRARIMLTPEFLGSSVATVRRGHMVKVLLKRGSWFKVDFHGKVGWLHRNHIVVKVIRWRSGNTGSGTTRGEAELSGRG